MRARIAFCVNHDHVIMIKHSITEPMFSSNVERVISGIMAATMGGHVLGLFGRMFEAWHKTDIQSKLMERSPTEDAGASGN